MAKDIKPVFRASDHSYTSELGRYTSVTTLLHKYTPSKDFKKIATLYVEKRSTKELYNDLLAKFSYLTYEAIGKVFAEKGTVEGVLHLWTKETERACEAGTSAHNTEEERVYTDKGVKTNDGWLCAGGDSTPVRDLYLLPDGVYPELLIWNNDLMVAGQADLVKITTDSQGTRSVYIEDYKGLALDTMLPTPSGHVTIKDVKVGDIVYDGNGLETVVTNISSLHDKPCYEILFNTGEKIVCDQDHNWVVACVSTDSLEAEATLTTKELYTTMKYSAIKIGVKLTHIECTEKELPLDPYVLGSWLADGDFEESSIRSPYPIWDTLDSILGKGNYLSNKWIVHNKCYPVIQEGLIKLGLQEERSFPSMYLRGGYEQRLALLRGYMDNAGHYSDRDRRCSTMTNSVVMKDGLMELISSLGMKPALLRTSEQGSYSSNFPEYRIWFYPDTNPFLARHKGYRTKKTPSSTILGKVREVVSVHKTHPVTTKCLTVDSNDHTYLISNMIKTHNTNKVILDYNYMNKYTGQPVVNEYLKVPLHSHCNCNYWLYQYQLNVYGWLLTKFGFKFGGGKIIHLTDNRKEYPLHNLQEKVTLLMNHFSKNHDNK
jgi:hypothetical protein